MKPHAFIAMPFGSKPDAAGQIVDFNRVHSEQFNPRQVFLFSGHMIDAPDRLEPRFPASQEATATRAINNTLDTLGAGPDDLALCSGACGGDIIFAEACLQRGVRLEVRLPFAIPTFLKKSVTFAGDDWRTRFYAIKNNPLTNLFILTDEQLPSATNEDAYARTNLWLLDCALAWGEQKVHFICLWNRLGGDGEGGTEHMYNEVNKRNGQIHVLDTNKLFKEEHHDTHRTHHRTRPQENFHL